ncbi:secretogranin-2a [Heptranchias perlo]|uniref:secretogranin-2a n=1 Tax=Heptranchias perlo TaxID=212740 RepID=UPI0035596AE6
MAVIKTFSSGTVLTLTILLYTDCLLAASLGAHRYDPGAFKESMYAYPNPDMIKALEFIENLRQNSEDTSIPDYEARGTFRPFQESLFKKLEGDDEENQRSDTTRESLGEDRAEWAKLLLQAVMQAESKAASVSKANGKHYNSGTRHHNQEEDTEGFEGNQQDYDGHELSESNNKLSRKHHIAFPEDSYRVNPYKRTNEIVEEQYTPQSLATLESAFRELGKYAGPYKEQERLEDEHFRKDEEEDISRGSDFAYEDVADGEDWNSVEMKNRHQHKEVQFKDEETEIDRDSDRAADNVKKSLAGFNEVNLDQLDSQEKTTMEGQNEDEMSDAAADLMLQYYKRLQDRMYEEQSKRDIGKADEARNVENEKMTVKQSRGSEDEIDPRIVDQLVELSSRLQIPPDDIVKMLKDAEQKKQADPEEIAPDLQYNGAESSEMDTGREKKRFRDSYTRSHIVPDNGDEDLTTEDILNILGVDDRMYEKPTYFRKADQSKNRLSGIHVPFERFKGNRNHESLRNGDGMGRGQTDDQDINTDDEELARYLERMLAKNPDFLNSADTPRPRMSTPVGDQVEATSYQDPIKELLLDINPRKAAEVMSIINNLSSFTGSDYHTPRRQQTGEDSSSLILKLMELISQQNDDRDRPVKESNREILGSDD